MRKIIRILGQKGRITIPYEIRMAANMQAGDIIRFTAEDHQVILQKENICDNCKNKPEALTEAVDQLSTNEKYDLAIYLLRLCGSQT